MDEGNGNLFHSLPGNLSIFKQLAESIEKVNGFFSDIKSFWKSFMSWYHRLTGGVNRLIHKAKKAVTDAFEWAGGSPTRFLLFITICAIIALAVLGVMVFVLFIGAATTTAVLVASVVALGVGCGLLSFFFTCVAAIYSVALSLAAFVIPALTASAVLAVLVTAGSGVLLSSGWRAVQKIGDLARGSMGLKSDKASATTAGSGSG